MDKIKIGITGQSGFMGTHLYNFLGLQQNVERIPFKDEYFNKSPRLCEFVEKCDVIVHLAAMNRHHDQNILHDTNVALVQELIQALEKTERKPHVLFSSSTQESRDNPYGRSKRKGRELLINWSKKHAAPFTGLVIPNVFGPFGEPFYNSVISTFSHQIVQNLDPRIETDAELNLIYINDLMSEIWRVIRDRVTVSEHGIQEIARANVSQILEKLQWFRKTYVNDKIIPDVSDYFDLCLFNTFRSYLPVDFFPSDFNVHSDDRGQFIELVKSDNSGQTSYSTTKPGITRGNHFHIRKIERFMVIQGEALMQLRRIGTDEVIVYKLTGDEPVFVDVPVWYTHNITNTGDTNLLTVFWINELFNPADPDTYYEQV
ncbi:MAG: NAD-dependent epimerase/dehydratase family protein [candidate division KSB1 bacterium]|nr:NAD-dependent epimerase/dehydratase family protein [candidate division KSB1 bacterium]